MAGFTDLSVVPVTDKIADCSRLQHWVPVPDLQHVISYCTGYSTHKTNARFFSSSSRKEKIPAADFQVCPPESEEY